MSYRSQNLLAKIKVQTELTPNITGRFAICLSLKDQSVPNPDEFDEKGSEIHPTVLFGEYEDVFKALMLQRLKKDKLPTDSEMLNKMLRAHFNRGVIALFARVKDLSGFYDMVKPEVK
jgi:DNA sulfur modification protein DndE